eukprot:4184250-Pyramimonas_sp.AAC.1
MNGSTTAACRECPGRLRIKMSRSRAFWGAVRACRSASKRSRRPTHSSRTSMSHRFWVRLD